MTGTPVGTSSETIGAWNLESERSLYLLSLRFGLEIHIFLGRQP